MTGGVPGRTAAEAARKRPRPALRAAYLLFVLLHGAAALWFPERIWGAHHLRFLPAPLQAAWFLLAAAPLLGPAREAMARIARRAARLGAAPGAVRALAGTIVLLLLFDLFRTRHLFLGDGALITSLVESPGESVARRAGWLTIQLYRALLAGIRIVHDGAGAGLVFRVGPPLFGVGAAFLAVSAARAIARDGTARFLAAAAILFSGGALLYFGYAENYAPSRFFLLLYLTLAIRRIRGRGGALGPFLALAASAALHTGAILFAPSFPLLLVRGESRRRRLAAGAAGVLLAAAAAALLLLFLHPGYGGAEALLPLLRRGARADAVLTPTHFLLAGNVLLLALGGAWLLPFLGRAAPADRGEVEGQEKEVGRFLLWTSLPCLAFLLAVDPLLGARDWDLLAAFLLPLLLFLIHRFLGGSATVRRGEAALITAALLLHTLPWIAVNANEERAGEMVLAMTAADPHHTREGARGSVSLGVLFTERGFLGKAETAFARAYHAVPDGRNGFNLGMNRVLCGRYEEAIPPLERAVRRGGGGPDPPRFLAIAYRRTGRDEAAERMLRRALRNDPDDVDALVLLGVVLLDRGRPGEALLPLRGAVRRDARRADAWINLGAANAALGNDEEARRAYSRALAVDPGNEEARSRLAGLEGGGGR